MMASRDRVDDLSWVVDEKERDGGWRWEWYGSYKRPWEIRSTTYLIGFRRPLIGVITPRIRTRTCRIGDGSLTRTWNSLSPSFSWWFPPSPLISLFLVLNSTITSEYKVKSSLSISPCNNHELTQSTASSQDRQSSAPSQFLISRRMLYSTLYIPTITSQPMNRGSAAVTPPSKSTASKYSPNLAPS